MGTLVKAILTEIPKKGRCKMKWLDAYRMRLTFVGFVATIVFGGSANADFVFGEPTKIEDRFEVSVALARYHTSRSNVYSSEGRREQATEYLEFHCDIGVLDPKLLLGVSPQGVITQFVDDRSRVAKAVTGADDDDPRWRRCLDPTRQAPKGAAGKLGRAFEVKIDAGQLEPDEERYDEPDDARKSSR